MKKKIILLCLLILVCLFFFKQCCYYSESKIVDFINNNCDSCITDTFLNEHNINRIDTCKINFENIFNRKISDIYIFSHVTDSKEISEIIGVKYYDLRFFEILDSHKSRFICVNNNNIVIDEIIYFNKINFISEKKVILYEDQFRKKYDNYEDAPTICYYEHYISPIFYVIKKYDKSNNDYIFLLYEQEPMN
ncbi:MAG: hypothetical protein IKN91_01310 [Paludibacteraceae bacterium]|nr:hypothetical protein [Paludibacteraceae bacterium]